MAAVKHARGVKLLLKVESQEVPDLFVAFCTINAARGITFSSATNEFPEIDCDNPDQVAWIVREKSSLSCAVTGAGILNTPDVQEFYDWLTDENSRSCEIVIDVDPSDGGVVFSGNFHLTDFSITGDRGSKMEATITLASDGEIASDPTES